MLAVDLKISARFCQVSGLADAAWCAMRAVSIGLRWQGRQAVKVLNS